ncbi:MAG: pirin family protein [Pseudomonadota bacterium]
MTQTEPVIITPKSRDIGGFEVRRVLPSIERRFVGPFVFFDHMGPADFAPGNGMDVRPHPHIGLATLTYLFEGEIDHKDSLGIHQTIRPGDVNWMTAGRGIVHSERTGPDARANGFRIQGIQSWLALPQASEEVEPAFHHHPAAALPVHKTDSAEMRVIVGKAYGLEAPVQTYSEMFYIGVEAAAAATVPLPTEYAERAVYVVEGDATVCGQTIREGQMVVLPDNSSDDALTVTAKSRLMILGGAPLDGHRHLWWNFVSSSKERIEQAKEDWKQGRFDAVPGETEFIPLPDH